MANLPYQIQAIIDQLGGLGLKGAFAYMGADTKRMVYSCDTTQGHSKVYEDSGLVGMPVGLWIPLHSTDARMGVCIEPDDTYTIYIWRQNRSNSKAWKAGKFGSVVSSVSGVYNDQLQSTAESMYDEFRGN